MEKDYDQENFILKLVYHPAPGGQMRGFLLNLRGAEAGQERLARDHQTL